MNPRLLLSTLVERGLDPIEASAKAALYDLVLSTARQLSSVAPAHAWWIPGRLEVFGKHTDYAGGRTLVAAIPRGIALLAAPRTDGTVTVTDARNGENVSFGASQPPRVFTDWRVYVDVVLRRLVRNFPRTTFSGDIVFASDLPRASGMSSSSALIVGVATALARLAGLESRPEWHANVRGALDAAGYYACIENGLTFGTLRGDGGVGTHGGSEDHAAIVCATPDHVSAFAFAPLRPIGIVRVPDAWRFVIASSGVTAEKTGAARDAYNRLAGAARLLLDIWNREGAEAPSLAAAMATGPSATARLLEAVRRTGEPRWKRTSLERRLTHFVREDARVTEALGAFQTADATALAAITSASQADAEILLGNQLPETTALVCAARDLGAIAASSFGAGFGGSVWALVHHAAAPDFADRWLAAYHSSHRRDAVAFAATPGPPLTELSRP